MKTLLTTLLLASLIQLTHAQTGSNVIGARSTGMGGASVTLQELWSTFNNQAGLAYVEDIEAGLAYESRFSLNELSLKSIAIAIPTNSGVFGFAATSFGFSDYAESKYGISYGRLLAENISFGGQINYQNIRLPGAYGNWSTVSGELGLQAKITKELSIGAHIVNPAKIKIAENPDERLASIIKIGSVYQFSENVLAAVEVEKVINQDASLKTGIEYLFSEKIFFRGGLGTGPVKTNFGFGINTNNLKFDAAVWYHQILGFSPSLSLSYVFESSNK
ncbi:MAG: hypothetical protein ACI8XB_000207 [Patiriisocius sp.]|jgi:hypothetical protein